MMKTNQARRRNGAMRFRTPLAAAALAIAGVVAVGPVLAQPNASANADQWADNIAALAGQMRSEISRLPSDSASENFEAAILFLIEQSDEPSNVVCAALDVVRAEATTPANAQPALINLCRRATGRRGTGAIPNSGSAFGPSSFSAPIISTGGGSSGYTP